MIHVEALTKRYGDRLAVDHLSFRVEPGVVTGFLGPNGAGKSTTMRMILGLDTPTSGSATVNGRPLGRHAAPIAEIGALIEAKSAHPKRSARNHLRALAATSGVPDRRVDEVLELVGLESVAHQLAGGFSLGMGQRLGIASALLGDPSVVMLDEPVNGLDPEGILWIRGLLTDLAAEGRTVFVSSHLMAEMSMIAERFIVVGQGRLIADLDTAGLAAMAGADAPVRVRAADSSALRAALTRSGVGWTVDEHDVLTVSGLTSDAIGTMASELGVVLHELTPMQSTLEEIFMELTGSSVEYHGTTTNRRAA